MKIFTLGNGFVADHLFYPKIDERVPLNSGYIRNMLDDYKPDVLINCIGKTGRPNVDWCEDHKEETAKTNISLSILLAEECARKSIHLIQIGSGCIYFGESPNTQWVVSQVLASNNNFEEQSCKVDFGWQEKDFANPKSFYSKTKYACDLAIGDMKNVTTLRIRMPISIKNNPRNLINKLRGYDKLIDIPNSMTFMDDLVLCIDWAAHQSKTGIYHVTNSEPLTAVRIMQEYQKYVQDHKFDIITEEQLDKLTLAKRSNCLLDSSKLREAGFLMSPSEEALKICMAKYISGI